MAVQLNRRRFTVDDYYRMADAGILTEDDRVELLDGEIIQMSPIGPLHGGNVDDANRVFLRTVGDRAIVRVQNPVRLDEHNEPEPDLVLARPQADRYHRNHPGPADVLLVVEVSDTTLQLDRQVKLRLYARYRIPEVWIENLGAVGGGRRRVRREPVIEVYRHPGPRGYQDVRIARRGERISPALLPEVEIAVNDLLGTGGENE